MDAVTVNECSKIAQYGGVVLSGRLIRNGMASFDDNRPQHSVTLPHDLQPKAHFVVSRMVRAVCLQWDR